MLNYLKIISRLSIIKTIYINFRCLPFHQACRFPIFIGRNVHFRNLSGKLIIDTVHVRTGMISFGTKLIFRDDIRTHSYLDIRGNILFKGKAVFHTGITVVTKSSSELVFGDNYKLGADSMIYVRKKIVFGDNVNISWSFQILDTDFHYVRSNEDVFNNTKEISIGNYIWIGNHVTIAKGVVLPDYIIVSSRSHVTKKFKESRIVVGGIPAKCLALERERVWNYSDELNCDKLFGNQ